MEAPDLDSEVDVVVDFMDLIDDHRLWARPEDVRPGVVVAMGRYVIAGDDDADSRVARVVVMDAEGNVELEILSGSVASHRDLLTTA